MTKLYSMWDHYEMRSSRSNCLSSNSSLESIDSAYRSAPGTPRNLLHGARSPYLDVKLDNNHVSVATTIPAPVPTAPSSSSPKSDGADSVLKQALSMPPFVAQHTWFHPGSTPSRTRASEDLHRSAVMELSRRAAHEAIHNPPPPPPPHTTESHCPVTAAAAAAAAAGVLPPPHLPPAMAAMMYQQHQLAMQQYAAVLHQQANRMEQRHNR